MSFTRKFTFFLFLAVFFNFFSALQAQPPDVVQKDILKEDTAKRFRKYDILPAISYAPETQLTLGVIGYRYLDFSKGDPTTIRSFINLIAIYTTANQIILESNWDMFTSGNKWRFSGTLYYNKYPDRNYAIGNDADALVFEYDLNENVIQDTTVLNYKRFSINRVTFQPIFLKEFSTSIYGGLTLDFEYQYNLVDLADSFEIIRKADEIALLEDNMLDLRSGLGLVFYYDSRDILLNPRKGAFLDLRNKYFGKFMGSKYNYITLTLDARKYFNPVSNHTLALRGVLNYRFTNDEVIPIRGMSRVGGVTFVRGYFKGTFQDNNMAAFEGEYRIPLWKDGKKAPWFHFWKWLGLTGFVSAAQVFSPDNPHSFNSYNVAAGGGLRILFNPESKVNIRIDYAVGLAQGSNGPGKRQTGLYFFLAEAF